MSDETDNSTASGECDEGLKVCSVGSCGGLIMPLFGDDEQGWNQGMRALIYLTALFYLFLGVNVVSDYFMNAVEMITSKKIRVQTAEKRWVTTMRWNDTVANLTLLALGSSAPEILLSCIEMLKDEGYSGALGPSTIVGSAAFNLFVIVGVCIIAITDPADHRAIEGLAVYHVTLIFSLFAYFWLWFIVVVSSPDVVDPWEAGLALVMFPVLVLISWLTDKGYMPFMAMDPLPSTEDDTEHKIVKHPRVRMSQLHLATTQEFEEGRRKTVQMWKEELIADDPENVNDTVWPYRDSGKGIEEEPGKLIDNEYGIIAFRSDTERTKSRDNHRHSLNIDVLRRNGTNGTVTCEFRTESLTAVPSQDFVGKKGHLEFGPGEERRQITVEILGKRLGEPEDAFQLVLSDIKTDGVSSDYRAHFNPYDDGGREKAVCTITIANGNEGELDGCLAKLGALSERWFVDRANFQMGLEAWSEQIKLACSIDPEAGDDDAEEEEVEIPGPMDYVMHTISLPWKMLFALLCPPSNWCGGWFLFGMALLYIGACTAVVIDLASFFGCCAEIPEEVTAVTIVALGTSLPDMFASITSAREDDHADASIVNVTGSNSVNVFLGIGLPWTFASILWSSVWGATDDWKRTYADTDLPGKHPGGAFVVQAGALGFSVLIFFFLAAMCVIVLRIRRIRYSGELGGPTLSKNLSSGLLFGLWATYITTTIWKSSSSSSSDLPLFLVMGACVCTMMAGAIVEVQNKISPRDPGAKAESDEELASGQLEGNTASGLKNSYEQLEEGGLTPSASSPGPKAPSDVSTQDGATSASGLSRRSQIPEQKTPPPGPPPGGAGPAARASAGGSVASGATESDASRGARDPSAPKKKKKARDRPGGEPEAAADAVGAAAAQASPALQAGADGASSPSAGVSAAAPPQTYGRGNSDAGLSASSGDAARKKKPRDPSKPRDPNKPRREKKDGP